MNLDKVRLCVYISMYTQSQTNIAYTTQKIRSPQSNISELTLAVVQLLTD